MSLTNRKSVLDPIDVVTGECYVQRTDFSLPGTIPIEWKTYYSSQLNSDGPMGWGWTYFYNRYLIFDNSFVAYIDEQGSVVLFPSIPKRDESIFAKDNRHILIRKDEDIFELHLPDKLILSFNGNPSSKRARLEKISNRNNNSIMFLYSGDKNLTKIIDSARRILDIRLDNSGHITSVTCSQEGNSSVGTRLVSYSYDNNGNLIEANDANNYTSHYEYDTHHHLTKRTDRNGYSFNYQYEDGRCVKTWGDDGLFSGEFTYDLKKRRTIFKGFDGRKIEYRYNENNLVTEEIDPYGRITKNTYDDKGNLVAITDRCERWNVCKYDDYGNKLEETDYTGKKTAYSYDKQNLLVEKIESSGDKISYEYDDRDNLKKEEKSNGEVTLYEYNSEGYKILSQSTAQLPRKYVYDQYHQLTAIQAPFAGADIVKYEYNMLGNVTAVWDGSSWVRHVYDNMSQLIEIRYPDGTTEKNAYDPEGNPISYIDRLGRMWRYIYKSGKQLIEIIAPDGGITKYDYTKADEISSVIDPNGNRIEYVRDQCDYIVGIRNNGIPIESYERDPEGRLIAKKGSDSTVMTNLAFDVWNDPIIRIIDRAGKKIESNYTYDKNGQLTKAINEFAEIKREYDSAGRIISEYCDDKGVRHEYNESGKLLKTTFDDGVEFRINHHGEASAIRDPNGGWHTIYFDGKRVQKRAFANGIEESFDYDLQERIAKHKIITVNGKQEAYLDQGYDYNVLGHIVRLKYSQTERSFEYDACDRLVAIKVSESPISKRDEEKYTYDVGGNIISTNTVSNSLLQSGNRVVTWGDRRFSYDSRGRLAFEEHIQDKYKYNYDSADQLISVDLPDNQIATYEYDGLRRRTSKQINDKKTVFGWDGNRLSWEIYPDGKRRHYFYANPNDYNPIMFCDSIQDSDGKFESVLPLLGGTRTDTYYIHNDSFNRPFLITDNQGKVVWSAQFTAYGKAYINSDSIIDYNLRTPGQYYDAETGLHYNYHRYYDPDTCRYIQPDPIGLAGNLNLYAYGEGNPFKTCEILGLTNT